MGKNVFTRSTYTSARSTYCVGDVGTKGTTIKAEQKAFASGKLEPLVDPSGFGVVRLSLPRVTKLDDGRYELNVGVPMPIENRIDTTGSMGGNVDIALDILPDAFDSWREMLNGYDIQVATGIFADCCDRFVLCRPQFEMDADKIVGQLSMMVPERGGGGNGGEDPDYGLFGAAYLTRAYINRIGLKGYDFTVTDEPGRGRISDDQLRRVFGDEVFKKAAENGHNVEFSGTMYTSDIWEALLNRAHAFVLIVDGHANSSARRFWIDMVGPGHVINLPSMQVLPQVQAAIIGLTEGTLQLSEVSEYLQKSEIDSRFIDLIQDSLVDIPVAAQQQAESFSKLPKKGDIFDGKPDVWKDENLWPSERAEEVAVTVSDEEDDWK